MSCYLLQNALMINEGQRQHGHLLIQDDMIAKIYAPNDSIELPPHCEIIDVAGKYVLPGVIDDQVHFRDPGLTHKADIATESKAAVAGGVCSFMDMPNTIPNALTVDLLEEKYAMAAHKSLANYSFYMGVSNENTDEAIKIDPQRVCGIKVFLGASTGNMLVDDEAALEAIFKAAPCLVAVHCEHEPTIQANLQGYRDKYGDAIPFEAHPKIRSHKACFLSSEYAINLAKKHDTRLHILHLSTADEVALFSNDKPLREKKITGEVCVHHLWFHEGDYASKQSLIKWNPAVKTAADAQALLQALKDDVLDVIATDHAPHTWEEKQNDYMHAPSGAPLVQHALVTMLEMSQQGKISVEKVVEKMCHAPAELFSIDRRGYIREGYYADLVVVAPQDSWTVSKENILYKCAWSPLEGQTFQHKVHYTFVNGKPVYAMGAFQTHHKGQRLHFNR